MNLEDIDFFSNYILLKRNELDFNLDGRHVCTELASGSFFWAAMIPLIIGANRVSYIVKDSQYHKAGDLKADLATFLNKVNATASLINTFSDIDEINCINDFDIITNTSSLRPISSNTISCMKANSVISLMFDAWELREEDIDLAACKKHSIKVVGTNENNKIIPVFDNVTYLFVKMILDIGSINGQKVVIYSDDDFGNSAKRACELLNAAQIVTIDSINSINELGGDYDLLLLTKYNDDLDLIGPSGALDLECLYGVTILHMFGLVNYEYSKSINLRVFPKKRGYKRKMTRSFEYLDTKVVIDLFICSYKAAVDELNGVEKSQFSQRI